MKKPTFTKVLQEAKLLCGIDCTLIAKNEYSLSEEKWVELWREVVSICRDYADFNDDTANVWRIKQAYMNRQHESLRDLCFNAYNTIVINKIDVL